ncbi:unnamed protein product [Paramecium octaurelia]|uniref:Uncharacterized protein n=1 Tax=Paramecium octaurelia TaxID=43137 RepID=A0A8S1XUD8_PAROT|nr:unnamed protein product [Paramecium octaurelia]
MLDFDPALFCSKHGEKIDVYCKNPNCTIETKICCNACAQELHNHQTTRICELKNVYTRAIEILNEKDQRIEQYFQDVKAKVCECSKQIRKYISFLEELIKTPQSQTLTNLKEGLRISTSPNLVQFSEKINKIESQSISDYCIASKTAQYVKLLEENKNDQAKEVLQDIINRYKQNEIYKREMKRLKGELNQNSRPQNNNIDVQHLTLQYKSFLQYDQNTNEALKILDQLLENDKHNFIYLRERVKFAFESKHALLVRLQSTQQQMILFSLEIIKLQFIILTICYKQEKNQEFITKKDSPYFTQKNMIGLWNLLKKLLKPILKTFSFKQLKVTSYLFELGQLLFAKKDINGLKVMELDLKNWCHSINHVIQGQILILEENYEKAYMCFEEAISTNYFSLEAHFLKALCISKTQNTIDINFTPEELLQRNLDKLPSDISKFKKFNYMYLEGSVQQNNQFQLDYQRLNQLYQPQRQYN